MKKIFNIASLCLILTTFVFSCTTEDGLPDYVGTWFGGNLDGVGSPADLKFTLRADGTYEGLMYDAGTTTILDNSNRGTYTCANNIFTSHATEIYSAGSWIPQVMSQSIPYSISGNTMTLSIDYDQNGTIDFNWELTRQ